MPSIATDCPTTPPATAAGDRSARHRVAVVGSGVAGLCAAWRLAADAGTAVTLFESEPRFGGHAHTVDVELDGVCGGVDTGFLVFNERTYPELIALFARLGVATAPSDMSFSVQAEVPDGPGGWARRLEWSGSSLATVFAQRSNLARPAFWGMLTDIARFNKLATGLARSGGEAALAQPIEAFLAENRFGRPFRDWYLLPMVACIWSCPIDRMLAFPMATLIRFCHNHGLLQVTDRPQWHTVAGGSRRYVQAMVASLDDARSATPVLGIRRIGAGVLLRTCHGSEHFDDVVLACHSDQALALLRDDATQAERAVLGAIGYQRNHAVLHTDSRLLPTRRPAWAAWNYEHAPVATGDDSPPQVCVHYWLNRLQPLPFARPVVVSLNPVRQPLPDSVLGRYDYAHPVFDAAAVAAQARLPALQGRHHTWFCGAWTGYGFHEDGARSGLAVARSLLDAVRSPARPARVA